MAVVGAGLTGLWTAHYLAEADPTLRIAVLEAEVAGLRRLRAQRRLVLGALPRLARHPRRAARPGSRPHGRAGALAQHAAMRATVDEVVRAAAAEGIDAHVAKGGTDRPGPHARPADPCPGRGRARPRLGSRRGRPAAARPGRGRERSLRASGTLGATYTPDCAALHPARLVRGLARAVERRGVRVLERTPVTSIAPGRCETPYGVVRADVVVRATEGYTPAAGRARARPWCRCYSLVIATEPLPDAVWDEIGLARRETFTDHRHLIVYGQRTADERLVFGGRGAPYHLGSAIRPGHDRDPRVHRRAAGDADRPVPGAGRTAATCGSRTRGAARSASRATGAPRSAWTGAPVWPGPAGTSATAWPPPTSPDARCATSSWATTPTSPRCPGSGTAPRDWEREPLRWLGINAGLRAMTLADAEESLTRRPSLVARAVAPLLG